MINWIKYDPYSRTIESHVTHLVTNGENIWLAHHAKLVDGEGYGWHFNGRPIGKEMTHWSPINLPGEETDNA